MENKKVLYKEIFTEDGFERWYYAVGDSNAMNEMAIRYNSDNYEGIFYCVCNADEAIDFGIKNLPLSVLNLSQK